MYGSTWLLYWRVLQNGTRAYWKTVAAVGFCLIALELRTGRSRAADVSKMLAEGEQSLELGVLARLASTMT